jgi:hypothetical protein
MKFTWHDRLIVAVSEMNRASALRVAQSINALLEIDTDKAGFMSNEIQLAFVLNAPCKVVYDGAVLDAGTHHLDMGEGGVDLMLPLTREGFEMLPVSLTALWIEAAEKENEWLSNRFLQTLSRITPFTSEPSSANAVS